jgi:hypothetical protein
MQLDPRIYVVIIVPDSLPGQATPLQGFAPSLCSNSWMIEAAMRIPSTIFDPTPEGQSSLLARRMGGTNPINWIGQTPRAIRSHPLPESLPFTIVMLGDDQNAAEYVEWASSSVVPPTLVAKSGANLTFSQLNLTNLQQRFLGVCEKVRNSVESGSISRAVAAIRSWEPSKRRPLPYQVRGHNSVTPNLRVLESAGFTRMVAGPMQDIMSGNAPFVNQIVSTSNSILALRSEVRHPLLHRVFQPTLAINIFAPAIYPDFFQANIRTDIGPVEREQFLMSRQALERQSGYSFIARTPAQIRTMIGIKLEDAQRGEAPKENPLMMARAGELKLSTECIAALAVSELSAVLRLPNAINRTSGSVRNFAAQYRSGSGLSRKRLVTFRAVQRNLASAVPPDFIQFLNDAETGVRIVADAHLEWLDIGGLPLCIQKNTTRIPVTPGNLFIENVSARQPIIFSPKDLTDILVIDALERGDPIRPAFEIAFEAFEPHLTDQLNIRFREVSNEEELVEAFNSFSGNIVIFDGHGGHEIGEAATLYLKDIPIDIWSLRGKLSRVPPIVILSACDTHAADRNHATTANGFLALGAVAVLASVFPLDAREAAAFIARLLFRIASYVPSAPFVLRRSISWMEIIAGMLRMQLLTNFLRQLLNRNFIDEKAYIRIHNSGNEAINDGTANPFGVVHELLKAQGLVKSSVNSELEIAVANSPAISYLQLGRPEAILIEIEEKLDFLKKAIEEGASVVSPASLHDCFTS